LAKQLYRISTCLGSSVNSRTGAGYLL